MRGGRRLFLLLAAHVIFWLLSVILSPIEVHTRLGLRHILVVPLFALTFAQVNLLGIWAVFSPSGLCYRLIVLVLGTACLEIFFEFAPAAEEFLYLPYAAMAFTVASLLVVRRVGLRLSLRADAVTSSGQESRTFRFSTRDWIVVTAVVALLSAVTRGERVAHRDFHLVYVTWAVCFTVVSLLTLWSTCGLDGSLRRSLSAVAVSLILGVFFACAANASKDGWVYIIMIMLLYSAVLLGSLLVVRSCGYRLVRRPASCSRQSGERIPSDGVGLHSVAN